MFSKGTSNARTTQHAAHPTATDSDHIRVVGYVRVSTDMQAHEGVSLDAQSEKIKAYCKLHDVELVGIYKDEGLSAKSLERPGLTSALAMLERGKANTLLIVKLDRLTRSLRDLDALIRDYFTKERYHLLSVSESFDTRTAMGRFVLYILGLIAQWEREAISERTRDALAHLRSQGVQMGTAPYGFAYSEERDDAGHKYLVEVPEKLKVVARILELFDAGTPAKWIAAQLNDEGVAAPKGNAWYTNMVGRILQRNARPGRRKPYAKRVPRVWDRERATELALACRKEGLTLRAIGKRLDAAKLSPARGGVWHAASVSQLLGPMSAIDAVNERIRAQQLRAEGRTLREVGRKIRANDSLWQSLAFDGVQHDGRGGLLENRRCPNCGSTLSRAISPELARVVCQHQAAVHALSEEAIADAGTAKRKLRRGFAAMSPERQRAIARVGGLRAHQVGRAHCFTSEEARIAGQRGGRVVSADKEHMSEIGRRGGIARSAKRH